MFYCPYQDDTCIHEDKQNINCKSCIYADEAETILNITEQFNYEDDPNNIYFEEHDYYLQIINNEDFEELDKQLKQTDYYLP